MTVTKPTVGSGETVSTILLVTALHNPTGSSVVMVNVTEPPEISPADGVYVAALRVGSSKVPVPDVVQVLLEAPPPNDPFKVYDEPSQIDASGPALTVAPGSIVRIISSVTAKQGPPPSGSFEVMVNVTVPEIASAAECV